MAAWQDAVTTESCQALPDFRQALPSCWRLPPGVRAELPTLIAMDLAVIDPLPMYQEGIIAVLSAAGYHVEVPSDVLAWANSGREGLILMTLATAAEWDLLGSLREAAPRQRIIAVVTEGSAGLGARAIRAGARSVLPRDVTAAVLRRTVEATLGGQAVLPANVAVALATGIVSSGDVAPAIIQEHLGWLRRLDSGMTVAQLAQHVGYSERAMYRLLRQLYERLGVRNRNEAIVRAREQNLL